MHKLELQYLAKIITMSCVFFCLSCCPIKYCGLLLYSSVVAAECTRHIQLITLRMNRGHARLMTSLLHTSTGDCKRSISRNWSWNLADQYCIIQVEIDFNTVIVVMVVLALSIVWFKVHVHISLCFTTLQTDLHKFTEITVFFTVRHQCVLIRPIYVFHGCVPLSLWVMSILSSTQVHKGAHTNPRTSQCIQCIQSVWQPSTAACTRKVNLAYVQCSICVSWCLKCIPHTWPCFLNAVMYTVVFFWLNDNTDQSTWQLYQSVCTFAGSPETRLNWEISL